MVIAVGQNHKADRGHGGVLVKVQEGAMTAAIGRSMISPPKKASLHGLEVCQKVCTKRKSQISAAAMVKSRTSEYGQALKMCLPSYTLPTASAAWRASKI